MLKTGRGLCFPIDDDDGNDVDGFDGVVRNTLSLSVCSLAVGASLNKKHILLLRECCFFLKLSALMFLLLSFYSLLLVVHEEYKSN